MTQKWVFRQVPIARIRIQKYKSRAQIQNENLLLCMPVCDKLKNYWTVCRTIFFIGFLKQGFNE